MVDDHILVMYGKKKVENGHEILEAVTCLHYRDENSPASRFCNFCGFVLRDEATLEALERRKQ